MSKIIKNTFKNPGVRASFVWAMLAIGFGGLTYYLIGSSASQNRLMMLVETSRAFASYETMEVATEQPSPGHVPQTQTEVSRLTEEITLAKVSYADLKGRVQALEEALGPLTVSIGDEMDAPETTAALSIGVADDTLETPTAISIGANDSIRDIPLPETEAVIPLPEVRAERPQTVDISATDFGLELAATLSLSDGRALWQEIMARYPEHLTDLTPKISIVETEGGRLELRLLAGPIRNAGAAATLCGELRAMGQTCNNTVFEGQTLAMR